MRVLRWLATYWYIPFLAFAGLVGFAFGLRKSPTQDVAGELHAIKEAERIRVKAINEGADAARKEIERKYRKAIQSLEAENWERYRKLRNDPVARVRFLERLSRKR